MAGLKDAAERTGSSVENLSALKAVAKVGGHDFEQIEAAIVKLNKALHGTDDESKGAGKALAAVGLNIKALREEDPAAAVLDIAKAFDKFADGGGKSAAAVAIFGKAGAQLLPFLKDLAEQQELVGKVTAEQAEMADRYEKNLNRLSAQFGNASKAIAGALLPTMAQLSNEFTSGTKTATAWPTCSAAASRSPLKRSLSWGQRCLRLQDPGVGDRRHRRPGRSHRQTRFQGRQIHRRGNARRRRQGPRRA